MKKRKMKKTRELMTLNMIVTRKSGRMRHRADRRPKDSRHEQTNQDNW